MNDEPIIFKFENGHEYAVTRRILESMKPVPGLRDTYSVSELELTFVREANGVFQMVVVGEN